MAMQYRKLPRGEEMLSTIGLGTSFMHLLSEQQVAELMNVALDGGINVIDFLSPYRKRPPENRWSFPVFFSKTEKSGLLFFQF